MSDGSSQGYHGQRETDALREKYRRHVIKVKHLRDEADPWIGGRVHPIYRYRCEQCGQENVGQRATMPCSGHSKEVVET